MGPRNVGGATGRWAGYVFLRAWSIKLLAAPESIMAVISERPSNVLVCTCMVKF